VDGMIELRLAPALETLDGLIAAGESGSFDFIFIDADKSNYVNYYERALTLLRPGGLMAADNTLRSGKLVDPGNIEPDTLAIHDFNRKLHNDPRIALTLATIGDGLTLACKL
jgi:caffeoyl-CoA O-methyltransferase